MNKMTSKIDEEILAELMKEYTITNELFILFSKERLVGLGLNSSLQIQKSSLQFGNLIVLTSKFQ